MSLLDTTSAVAGPLDKEITHIAPYDVAVVELPGDARVVHISPLPGPEAGFYLQFHLSPLIRSLVQTMYLPGRASWAVRVPWSASSHVLTSIFTMVRSLAAGDAPVGTPRDVDPLGLGGHNLEGEKV